MSGSESFMPTRSREGESFMPTRSREGESFMPTRSREGVGRGSYLRNEALAARFFTAVSVFVAASAWRHSSRLRERPVTIAAAEVQAKTNKTKTRQEDKRQA
jgi:hypothetical protein